MKRLNKSFAGKWLLSASFPLFMLIACKKDSDQPDNTKAQVNQTKTFSSDVVTRWVGMQLDMLRLPLETGAASQGADRTQAYCGIALYEAVVNGMPAYQSLGGQLTDFPAMPKTEQGATYHWAACANAALAGMNRKLFPNASAANKTAMDNLEATLQANYAAAVDAVTLQRSVAFGKEIAARVFEWAANDGSANVNPPYIPPVGPGLWVPTAATPPANPYAVQRRLLVPGVAAGTQLVAPPPYSADAASPFFALAKDVYDKSQVLTQAQRDLARYYQDSPGQPGFPGAGHFVAIFAQVLTKAAPQLDDAALAYAKSGIALSDALTLCFINKYNFKQLRPITYIRNEMGYATWSPLFATPNHPEFPSAHSSNAGGMLTMLSNVFGENFEFTETTYEYMGLANRNYHSFSELKKAIGDSRVYGGIHFQSTCDKSTQMGEKVAENVLTKVKFKR